MSTYRDLKNAQQALNEACQSVADDLTGKWLGAQAIGVDGNALRRFMHAWDEFDALRLQFDGDRPASASDTSIAAAKTRPLLAGSLRRRVVEAIVAHYKLYGTGLTTDQAEGRFKRSHQSVSSAVNDMTTKGWIKDSGTRRQTRSNCKAMVLIPTDLALGLIEQEH